MSEKIFYVIYSVCPCGEKEDEYRLVEMFETKEDAMVVFNALEAVNISFSCYRLEEETREQIKRVKIVKRQ